MMSGARETEMKGEINKSKSCSGWALEWQTAFITAIPSAYGPSIFLHGLSQALPARGQPCKGCLWP